MSATLPTRIYLTGFMGSGKSMSGPHLARRIGYRFIDVDRRIEEEQGVSIPRLFAERGEAEFRRIERRLVLAVTDEDRVVVSLGGGAVADDELRGRLLATGTLVWLRVPPETLALRLSRSARRRPLLWDGNGHALEGPALVDRIRSLLEKRMEAYAAAQVAIDADSASAHETALRIERALTIGSP